MHRTMSAYAEEDECGTPPWEVAPSTAHLTLAGDTPIRQTRVLVRAYTTGTMQATAVFSTAPECATPRTSPSPTKNVNAGQATFGRISPALRKLQPR